MTFYNDSSADVELRFHLRLMTKEEYRYWCRMERYGNSIKKHFFYRGYIPLSVTMFSNHLWSIRDAVKARQYPPHSRYAVDAYQALTPGYMNVLADRDADEAWDYADPEGDSLRAYERMLSDNFEALYGTEREW